jgi:hypothetical protein
VLDGTEEGKDGGGEGDDGGAPPARREEKGQRRRRKNRKEDAHGTELEEEKECGRVGPGDTDDPEREGD